jgi:hypothetical protein
MASGVAGIDLAGADPELIPSDDYVEISAQLLTAGQAIKDIVADLGRFRRDR